MNRVQDRLFISLGCLTEFGWSNVVAPNDALEVNDEIDRAGHATY